MNMLKHLRKVERQAYPEAYRAMQDVRTMADLRDYCEGEPTVWTWEGGYCIATDDEIVDLASIRPLSLRELRKLLGKLAVHFGGQLVSLDARAGTSWKLIQYAAKRGLLEIVDAEPYNWAGEQFWETELRFL